MIIGKKDFTYFFIRFLKEEKIYHEFMAEMKKYAMRMNHSVNETWWYRLTLQDYIDKKIFRWGEHTITVFVLANNALQDAFPFNLTEKGEHYWWNKNRRYKISFVAWYEQVKKIYGHE